MLPPIDDSTLKNNPKFAALHATLANNILDATGSTKRYPSQKEHEAVTKSLKAFQTRISRSYFIKDALTSLDLSTPSTTLRLKAPPTKQPAALPVELICLIILLSARFNASALAPSSQKLLESSSPWTSLPSYLPHLGSLVSTHLQTQALGLCRILTPTTNPSYLHRAIPKLVASIQSTQGDIENKKAQLSTQNSGLVSKITVLLSMYHFATVLTIRLLEQTKHGSVSRHIKSQAEYLSLLSKHASLETKEKAVKGDKMVYTDEVKLALGEYLRHLRDARERLKERKRDAERILWGYGVGRDDEGEKERVMKEISRVYGELGREIAEVGKDVARLRGR